MKPTDIPEIVFELAATKSFEELTEKEKEMVLTSFTEEEYIMLETCVRDFMEADRAIKAPVQPTIKPEASSTGIRKIANYPIPLYQVAAGLLLLLGIFFVMPEYRAESTVDITIVRDTIQTGTPLSADKYPEKLIFNP